MEEREAQEQDAECGGDHLRQAFEYVAPHRCWFCLPVVLVEVECGVGFNGGGGADAFDMALGIGGAEEFAGFELFVGEPDGDAHGEFEFDGHELAVGGGGEVVVEPLPVFVVEDVVGALVVDAVEVHGDEAALEHGGGGGGDCTQGGVPHVAGAVAGEERREGGIAAHGCGGNAAAGYGDGGDFDDFAYLPSIEADGACTSAACGGVGEDCFGCSDLRELEDEEEDETGGKDDDGRFDHRLACLASAGVRTERTVRTQRLVMLDGYAHAQVPALE